MYLLVADLVRRIRTISTELERESDEWLRKEGLKLKYRAMTDRKPVQLIPHGFALVTEAMRRVLGFNYYDEQLVCGIHLVFGSICEMKTGEGKTITAALPAFLKGLSGDGMHVATVNDYLASRDHEMLAPVYDLLGLSSDVILTGDAPMKRAESYRKDITYGTAKEFGFDFLRDRLKRIDTSGRPIARPGRLTMRPLNCIVVDEADSILIDEARTPLIVGLVDTEEENIVADCFRWAASHSLNFRESTDYTYDPQRQKVELTCVGRSRLRKLQQNNSTRQVNIRELYEYAENAIKVHRDFQLDKHYAVNDDQVVIIDEYTGRPAEGRQWQHGIHQSVQAKEQLPITPATRSAASITIQSFFRQYREMSGMTGTAYASRKEFRKVYGSSVARIPTHRPVRRNILPEKIFSDVDAKFAAVVDEIRLMIDQDRAVLVGTRSVEMSEKLSQLLTEFEVEHQVLNARYLAQEASIVAAAGQPRTVTVATNMAGRGTDIKLHQRVQGQGGLHVILTEIHESKRIDWQLIGRASRQGDPGSFRIFVSLDDAILKTGLGESRAQQLARKYLGQTKPLSKRLFNYFRIAQRKTERKHLVDRLILLRHEKDKHERMFETGQDPYLALVE